MTNDIETYEADKEFYRKADDGWLKLKISNEKESIKFNTQMINESKREIQMCEEILAERKNE